MILTDPVLVVGAGPAGATCAVHLAKMGARVDLAEQLAIGGALRQFDHSDIWVPIGNLTADGLVRHLHDAVHASAVNLLLGRQVVSIREHENGVMADATPYAAVILATGAMPRGREHGGNGVVVGAGKPLESIDVRGLHVAISGGGDNAFENAARMLHEGAASVQIFSRHAPRARTQLQRAAAAAGARMTVGEHRLHGRVVYLGGGTPGQQVFDLVAVLWGYEPRLPAIDSMQCGELHRVVSGRPLRRVWVIGDARDNAPRSILRAMGAGACAAAEVLAFLESGA